MPDSKPVHEAVKLINNGKFSASSRMASFLNNVNRFNIISKHISGKAKLNPISDTQSRSPAECKAELCTIHRFIMDHVDGELNSLPELRTLLTEDNFMVNRASWRKAQAANQACSVATKMLNTGKPPPRATGKHNGEYWNDVRKYHRDASVANDGTLVVKTPPDICSGNVARERIVIPKELTAALLYHMHNHRDNHPTKTQQKALFQRNFYAIGLDKQLELLYSNCYKCSVVQKLPRDIILNESKTMANNPHTQFHADVIRRSKQFILTVKDHFTSFQDAMLVDSEKAEDLKHGIITLTTAMRKPGSIYVTVDNCPGFQKLVNKNDNELSKLNITLVKTDEINKNANAVVDKGCRELEEELKRLDPEAKQLATSTLKQAILNLNSKLRRRGCLSAYEISTARDQNTGANLQLNDETLRQNQLQTRQQNVKTTENDVNVGDTVRIRNKNDKHKANEAFIVTEKANNEIAIQKIAHTLSTEPAKLMGKVYKTKAKYLITTHRPEKMTEDDEHCEAFPEPTKLTPINIKPIWSPINQQFFEDDDTDEEDAVNIIPKPKREPYGYEFDHENVQLQWDHTPEQYAIQQDNDVNHYEVMRPCKLFSSETDSNDSSSHEEVFLRKSPVAPKNPRLKRRNAIRIKNNKTEPRVTRHSLRSKEDFGRNARSQENSPTRVDLHRCQNLETSLNPRIPLIPDVVNLTQAQTLTHALDNISSNTRRWNLRKRPQVDYFKLHNGED